MIASASKTWTSMGLYTTDQAARLLGIRADMVNRWVYGNRSGVAAIMPENPDYRGECITFIDFVQAMAIRAIRTQKRLSLQKIRQTVEMAKKHDIDYPFARDHTTYVFSDDVVLRVGERLIQVTGKYKEQDLMEPIIEPYIEDLGFNRQGLAINYTPIRRSFREVILSPTIQFGAPTIKPCGYTVETLLNALDAEGNEEAAANICNVNVEDIRLAVTYEQQLQGRKAA